MHCLLCHEKIPRLRVWRTKSEFCCEEHAALYKKQTLERLLADPNAAQNGQGSLPEPPEPEGFEIDETETAADPRQARPDKPQDDFEFWERFDRADEAKEESVELPPPADEEASEGFDEVWRLTEESSHGGGSSGRSPSFGAEPSGVGRQSADEALEALRQLASRANTEQDEAGDPERPTIFEMPAMSGSQARSDIGDEPASYSEPPSERQPAAETPLSPTSGEEPEEASVLERLMAESDVWKPEPGADETAGEADEAVEAEARAKMLPAEQALGSESIEQATEAGQLDLEAPEPDWELADASSELSALKESLESTGSPPVLLDPEADVDVSPVEPDWEQLEALELSDLEIEPPEPVLEDDERTRDAEEPPKVVPFPVSEAAAQEEADSHEPAVAANNGNAAGQQRAAAHRFKPVLDLVEIRLDMAVWAPAETPEKIGTEAALMAGGVEAQSYETPGVPGAIGPRGGRIQGREAAIHPPLQAPVSADAGYPGVSGPDDIVPPAGNVFLPGCGMAPSGQTSELHMCDGSVDIEPAAALADALSEMVEAGPSHEIDAPFAPEGLFFDIPAPEAAESEENAGATGAAAGRRSEP